MLMNPLTELNRDGTSIVPVTHNPDYAAHGNRHCGCSMAGCHLSYYQSRQSRFK